MGSAQYLMDFSCCIAWGWVLVCIFRDRAFNRRNNHASMRYCVARRVKAAAKRAYWTARCDRELSLRVPLKRSTVQSVPKFADVLSLFIWTMCVRIMCRARFARTVFYRYSKTIRVFFSFLSQIFVLKFLSQIKNTTDKNV